MKKVLLLLIYIYQAGVGPLLKNILGVQVTCRYSPTCSENMKQMIQRRGAANGVRSGLMQLAACHPWSKKYGTNI